MRFESGGSNPEQCRRFGYRSAINDSKRSSGVDLISDALPFGRLWYTKPDDAIGYAKFRSRSHDAVIRVYNEVSNVIETHGHAGDFKEWSMPFLQPFDGSFPSGARFFRDGHLRSLGFEPRSRQ